MFCGSSVMDVWMRLLFFGCVSVFYVVVILILFVVMLESVVIVCVLDECVISYSLWFWVLDICC